MSLDVLKKLAKSNKDNVALPFWVSIKNLSLPAYECINKLKTERLEYISRHNKSINYKKKSLYQISASEVARAIGAATTTLISTSAYSAELKLYLERINNDLQKEKELRLSKHQKTLSAGMKQRKKDEIAKELQVTRDELINLKKQHAEKQLITILNNLSLPVKQKLGINI
jgi:hypothetical protein